MGGCCCLLPDSPFGNLEKWAAHPIIYAQSSAGPTRQRQLGVTHLPLAAHVVGQGPLKLHPAVALGLDARHKPHPVLSIKHVCRQADGEAAGAGGQIQRHAGGASGGWPAGVSRGRSSSAATSASQRHAAGTPPEATADARQEGPDRESMQARRHAGSVLRAGQAHS